eukprot:SAG22_NODE_11578_length_478_cov_0.936675_2_plen_27_part_01
MRSAAALLPLPLLLLRLPLLPLLLPWQ